MSLNGIPIKSPSSEIVLAVAMSTTLGVESPEG
nr:MAG TPA: hypothetical protein [Caudoviricetes sp.]